MAFLNSTGRTQSAEAIVSSISTCESPSPTGVDRDTYLDLAEHITRVAAQWQNDWGVIIDPYMHFHPSTATPRFVGALGQLIGVGRCQDLLDACIRGYEYSLACITDPVLSPEFAIKELVYAHQGICQLVPAERRAQWEASWQSYNGAACYNAVVNNLKNNFNTFALLGEFARLAAGLGGDPELVDRLLEKELELVDDHGMYQDPYCPMTYNIVVIQQWAMLLLMGYEGRLAAKVREVVMHSGAAALLLQSAAGQAPAGGRSNQFHFVEAQSAAMFEACACLARDAGDHTLAGAFKRAARRSIALIQPWLTNMQPFRHIKQGFHPSINHGTDSSGPYGIYGILPASLLAIAARIADDNIAERLTPVERGGYVFSTNSPFHQVTAACGGWSVQVDTKANLAKDATGLVRVHHSELRPETILAGGISRQPEYSFAFSLPQRNVAIGPQWRRGADEQRLADFSGEIEDTEIAVIEQTTQKVIFEITYRGALGVMNVVRERYQLTPTGLSYRAVAEPQQAEWSREYTIPIIETDGDASSQVDAAADRLTVRYRNDGYILAVRGGRLILTDECNTNRNATYRTARALAEGDGPLELTISRP